MAKKLPKEVKLVLEHTPHKIDYSKEKNISASQFMMFSDCEHRWKLSYIDKLSAYSPSVHTVFGTAMHEVIQEWLTVMYNESATAASKMNLRENLKLTIREVYAKERKKAKEVFTDADELNSFFLDGVKILDYLQKKRGQYFSMKGWHLAGIETDIVQEVRPGVFYKGFIDVVMYNSRTNKYLIIDIKTSTRGWSDYEKKNDAKVAQVLFYKEFFAKQFNVDIDNIDVEFFILRRKINEDLDFVPKRIQQWRPASGRIKRGKAMKSLQEFVDKAFTDDGQHDTSQVYLPNPSKSACRFCDFKNTEFCTVSAD